MVREEVTADCIVTSGALSDGKIIAWISEEAEMGAFAITTCAVSEHGFACNVIVHRLQMKQVKDRQRRRLPNAPRPHSKIILRWQIQSRIEP